MISHPPVRLYTPNLLTFSSSKIDKCLEYGYMVAALHLMPWTFSGKNLCTRASPG